MLTPHDYGVILGIVRAGGSPQDIRAAYPDWFRMDPPLRTFAVARDIARHHVPALNTHELIQSWALQAALLTGREATIELRLPTNKRADYVEFRPDLHVVEFKVGIWDQSSLTAAKDQLRGYGRAVKHPRTLCVVALGLKPDYRVLPNKERMGVLSLAEWAQRFFTLPAVDLPARAAA